MKVINKYPNYIRKTDRVKHMNQAYTVIFLSLNKIEADLKTTGDCIKIK